MKSDGGFATFRLGRTACQLCMFVTSVTFLSATLYITQPLRDSQVAENCLVREIQSPQRSESLIKIKSTEDEKSGKQDPKQTIKLMPHDKASILHQYIENGSTVCHQVATARAHVFGLPHPVQGEIMLTADEDHALLIVSYAENGQRRCSGGDYYEIDLAGTNWKSRPPVQDLGDGSYLVKLRVDSRFSGSYQVKVILLFPNLHGLDRSPDKWSQYDENLGLQILFVTINIRADSHPVKSALTPIELCLSKDFDHTSWQGRWTRTKMNETCTADKRGRFQCLPLNETCDSPWCTGPVGSLESNGWVYSTHCAFHIFSRQEAWSCLNNKWLYFWGDSNHQDTARNLLNFVLGFNLGSMNRNSDETYINPENSNETLRISVVFNGHFDERFNYKGLTSLQNETYRLRVRSSFNSSGPDGKVPDAVILNSGLHDGMFWSNFTDYVEAAEYAGTFWNSTWADVSSSILQRPKVVYRTTIAPAGPNRITAVNPQKVELENAVIVDTFVSSFGAGNIKVVDEFDMTFPWHYDKRYSDGQHYGRAPKFNSWVEGGHQYFIDLMLVHVHLNAICLR